MADRKNSGGKKQNITSAAAKKTAVKNKGGSAAAKNRSTDIKRPKAQNPNTVNHRPNTGGTRQNQPRTAVFNPYEPMNPHQYYNYREYPKEHTQTATAQKIHPNRSSGQHPQNVRRNGQPTHTATAVPRHAGYPKLPPQNGNRGSVKSQVRMQNPAARQKEQKKRRLNPHELEIIRRKETARRFYIKKHRENVLKLFFSRLFVFLCMFILCMSFSIGIFFCNLYSNGKLANTEITYQLGYDKLSDTIKHTYKYSYINKNGTFYINMTELAETFGFVTTGDVNELKYISDNTDGTNSEENIKFFIGTSLVHVNGVPIRLSAPSVLFDNDSGGNVWVPYEILNIYVNGIEAVYYEEEHKLIITRATVNDISDGSEPIYTDISFVLHDDSAVDAIAENSLTPEILESTNPHKKTEFAGSAPTNTVDIRD